jgi:hypothetical protein
MKLQIQELTRRVQNNGSSLHISNQKHIDNTKPNPGELPPLGMNYGCDHQELMTELKKVLAERQHN